MLWHALGIDDGRAFAQHFYIALASYAAVALAIVLAMLGLVRLICADDPYEPDEVDAMERAWGDAKQHDGEDL